MLTENININSEIEIKDNISSCWMPSSRFLKMTVILTSVTVGGGLGYFWNKITDEMTKNYPGSGYHPEIENRYGSLEGMLIGGTVGLLLSLSACGCYLLTDCFPKDEINNSETTPLLVPSTSYNIV